MRPEALGWDPRMKLYRKGGKRCFRFTHELGTDEVLKEFKDSGLHYRTHWAIEIGGKTYVTFRALSLSRAEVMCGRAQIVWLAVDIADRSVCKLESSTDSVGIPTQPSL
jgi:predicted GNAT family N-acyltransferase